MIGRSLSARLLFALIGAQVAAIMLAMAIFPLLAPFVSFSDLADASFRHRIERSVVRAPGGGLVVNPTPALERYQASRPRATFAVLSLTDGRLIEGSDPALGTQLKQIQSMPPRPAGNLITDLPGSGTLIITTEETQYGRLLFATTGNAFRLEDWPSLVSAFLPITLPAYGPVLVGALVLIPLIVTLVTRPLGRLSGQAAQISLGAMQLRLDEVGLGPELQSLAHAVNAALDRIEQGIARQRLYAANAAHELRTPVALLGLHVDQLNEPDLRGRLQSDVSRIQILVEQLVTVARLGQNHVAMDERLELVALLRDVVADRAPMAIRDVRELELVTDVPEYVVRGNRQALFSALANIVDNAIRAEPAGGTVSVRLEANGEVRISDHGPGIAPGDRANVFEPFWRGSQAGSGAGLGLAIVKEIADRHGVAVEAGATDGGGATFLLRFPKSIA